ncbi:MAG TPA: response regulator [Candidatus Ozemobacteraceae bacterium]|nr:response regulator [Candidatus Ozemobacteraceae bacterium]
MTILRCLQVEDSESDAALIRRLLQKSGFDIRSERVENAEGMRAALRSQPWDVIIADYQLPAFDAPAALAVLIETGLDIPFIVVSGLVGEEIAVEMMKRGAADYLTKERLSRLAPAVERELREAEVRRERRRAVAALADEKERLLVTLRSIGEGVITTDMTGRITLMNPIAEELTGCPADRASGSPFPEIFRLHTEPENPPCLDPVRLVVESGERRESDTPCTLTDQHGRHRPVAYTASPIRDAAGQIIGVVVVFRDLTREQKIQELLQNADKLQSIGVLAGGIAHDFNNLLSGIFCYIEIARNACRAGATDKAMARLGAAMEVFSRAKDLTRQLLTFSRGGQPVQRTMSLEPILRRSPTFMLSGSNVSCEVRIPADLWACHIDENQIAQAVDNLVLNARQAMPEGGRITIVAENLAAGSPELPASVNRDCVRISIRDTGPGIDPKLRTRIFDPFFTTKPAGNGLGLSIVYSILKRHGGLVDFDSSPGSGTTFRLYLPRAERGGREPELREAGSADQERPLMSGRALVMDDEEFMRDICRELLEECGFTVTTAEGGEEAIRVFRAAREAGEPFVLALLDLTIPGGKGGCETVAELRHIDPSICTIAASGYSADPVMASPAGYGFSACLVKPFKLEELFRALRACPTLPKSA